MNFHFSRKITVVTLSDDQASSPTAGGSVTNAIRASKAAEPKPKNTVKSNH